MTDPTDVVLRLSRDEALVLFGYSMRCADLDDPSFLHASEPRALANLFARLEAQLTEPRSPEYRTIIEEARERLASEAGG